MGFALRKLYASCFFARAQVSWKYTAGSSWTNSRRRWDKIPFSKLPLKKMTKRAQTSTFQPVLSDVLPPLDGRNTYPPYKPVWRSRHWTRPKMPNINLWESYLLCQNRIVRFEKACPTGQPILLLPHQVNLASLRFSRRKHHSRHCHHRMPHATPLAVVVDQLDEMCLYGVFFLLLLM